MKNNKILMIVNEFPPTGESGVQRPLKFLKYIDKAGWETHVVTTKRPPKLITDYTLLDEIPSRTNVYRTASWGTKAKSETALRDVRNHIVLTGNPLKRIVWAILKVINDLTMPFDKQIGWVPFAMAASIRVIQKHHIRNVYITAFPFSAFLVGVFLKWIYGKRIFWVADYRDAWQFLPLLSKNVLPFRMKFITRVDDYCLKRCDKALFVTDHIKNRYQQKFGWIKDKAVVITNGYDEDDFHDMVPHRFGKFTFLYMGKVHGTKGFPSPIPILKALTESVSVDFQYVHVGSMAPNVQKQIDESEYNFFRNEGYKPHKEAISYAAGADVNLIIINDDPESEGAYSGKLFELLRLGKPILVAGPRGSIIEDLLNKTGMGLCANLSDPDDLKQKIRQIVQLKTPGQGDMSAIEQFSRENLTRRLLELYK